MSSLCCRLSSSVEALGWPSGAAPCPAYRSVIHRARPPPTEQRRWAARAGPTELRSVASFFRTRAACAKMLPSGLAQRPRNVDE